MRLLIYFGCFLVLSMFTALLQSAGITLGAIPMVLLFSGTSYVARSIIRSLDGDDDTEADTVAYAQVQSWDQISDKIPGVVQDRCREFSSDPSKMEDYLRRCASSGLIQEMYIPSVMKAYLSADQFTQWQNTLAENNGSSITYAEIKNRVPQAVKDYCKDHAEDPDLLIRYLQQCAADRLISSSHIHAILKEFTAPASVQQADDIPTVMQVQPPEDTNLDDVLAHCSAIAHDYKQLESYIISCITSGKIDCETASQIWKAYYDSKK